MAKKAKKQPRAEWTKEHLKMLKTRFPKDPDLGGLARDLGRSEGAVRQKAFAEGISRNARAKKKVVKKKPVERVRRKVTRHEEQQVDE